MPGPGMELIGEEEKKELLEVLDAGRLYRYGSADDPRFKAKVIKLEQEVAKRVGVPYAVAVNSGTSALLVALIGLGVGPGDEVIVPGYTFIASISSIIYARAVPILAEVDRTLNLDPADVERKITPRTKAIMAVHMLGNPARLDELKEIADEHKLLLIEDCAQAFGARYKGRAVGSIGDVGTFSFNVYKTITAGDGGMLVTRDEEAYRRFFGLHDQGHSPLRTGVEIGHRPFVGLDFRMTELAAAVLLAQLRKLETILEPPALEQAALQAGDCRFAGTRVPRDHGPPGRMRYSADRVSALRADCPAGGEGVGHARGGGFRLARVLEHGADPGKAHAHREGLPVPLSAVQGPEPKVLERDAAANRRPARARHQYRHRRV